MTNIKKTTQWLDYINEDFIKRALSSPELRDLQKKAQKEYLNWDSFKYQPIPKGFTPEEAWALVKLERTSLYQKTLIKSVDGKNFDFAITNTLNQKLNFIDMHASNFLRSSKLSDAQKNKFIIAGLTEEAIATSQIEGANTSRKVAKEMLASHRKPRTKSEQMIINSYQMMQRLNEWKDLDLSKDMLIEIQKIVTEKTLEEQNDQGKFRVDTDQVVVKDKITNEIVHVPPKEEDMHKELERLINFANKLEEEEDNDFIHPVIKASLLHFWIAYLHPFVDGNGRTARAVFHWYLLKHDYWLVQYLTISRAIVNSRKRYDNAFIYSEKENDLTYFLFYIANAFKLAITKFVEYYEKNIKETAELKKVADKLEDYNARQIALLQYFLVNTNYTPAEISVHKAKHGVSQQTAYSDLMGLSKKGLLIKSKKGRKYVFIPNTEALKKLFTH